MRRVGWLKLGVMLAFLAISVRLFVVQILEHDDYVARASAQHMKKFVLPARRGMIYMMNGGEVVPVVMNESVYTVFVDPKMVKEDAKVEKVITRVVPKEKRVGNFKEAWSNRDNQYYVVGRELTRREAEAIKAEGLAGIGFTETVKRVYPEPEASFAAQTLGFVNNEGIGQYGVEGAFNEELSGKEGQLITVTDVNAVPLTIGEENVKEPAVNGKDIVLSIDRNVQRKVEKALLAGMERSRGTYASGLVMNPQNGQILAMANLPSFEPGDYGKVESAEVYQNTALVAAYEPASVCKTFTFATGVDRGLIRPSDTYNNTGFTMVDAAKISNVNQGHRGEISFQEALNYSLNTGSVEALRRFDGGEITQKGEEVLYEYYHDKFGLGELTGVEVYEERGQVISPAAAAGSGAAVRYANMTFGQGLAVTMLQIAAGYAAVVNGGEYYRPSLIAGEMVDGRFVAAEKANPVRRVVSEQTSATMREMLETARNGRPDLGRLDPVGYKMGAKSGTAEVPGPNGRYKKDEAVATYVGYGGRELPEYVIIVRIGGEGKIMDGFRDAGAVWTEISNYLIGYLKI